MRGSVDDEDLRGMSKAEKRRGERSKTKGTSSARRQIQNTEELELAEQMSPPKSSRSGRSSKNSGSKSRSPRKSSKSPNRKGKSSK